MPKSNRYRHGIFARFPRVLNKSGPYLVVLFGIHDAGPYNGSSEISFSDRKSFVLFVVDIIVVNFSSSSSFDSAYVANFNVP